MSAHPGATFQSRPDTRPTTVFVLAGAHTGDLLLALPAIGAVLAQSEVVVACLESRYYRALGALPVTYSQTPPETATTMLRPCWKARRHRTDIWLEMLAGRPAPVRVPIPLHGLKRANEILPGEGWAVLAPWADFPGKRWLIRRWLDVAGGLVRMGYRVAVMGPPQAAQMVGAICGDVHANLVGLDSPETWPALLARASLVVTTDTGAVHMADALGVPVIGLYGFTRLEEFGPYWDRSHCISAHRMDAITVEKVLGKAGGIRAMQRRRASFPRGEAP